MITNLNLLVLVRQSTDTAWVSKSGMQSSIMVQVPGDLDPRVSPHYLTTMKKAYLKLRYLVDSGCIFVGHDLRHDFKSINIIVPPQQVSHWVAGRPQPGT